jgi:uncharacterized membrane protein YhaH (DUF805 family)
MMPLENPYQSPLEICSPTETKEADSRIRAFSSLLFSFDGRISRKTFWIALVSVYFAFGAIYLVLLFIFGDQTNTALMLQLIPAIPFNWIYLALWAKRWHDRNKSTFWICLQLIPVLGFLWSFIEAGCLRGTEGPNRYGPDPLGRLENEV